MNVKVVTLESDTPKMETLGIETQEVKAKVKTLYRKQDTKREDGSGENNFKNF